MNLYSHLKGLPVGAPRRLALVAVARRMPGEGDEEVVTTAESCSDTRAKGVAGAPGKLVDVHDTRVRAKYMAHLTTSTRVPAVKEGLNKSILP